MIAGNGEWGIGMAYHFGPFPAALGKGNPPRNLKAPRIFFALPLRKRGKVPAGRKGAFFSLRGDLTDKTVVSPAAQRKE